MHIEFRADGTKVAVTFDMTWASLRAFVKAAIATAAVLATLSPVIARLLAALGW